MLPPVLATSCSPRAAALRPASTDAASRLAVQALFNFSVDLLKKLNEFFRRKRLERRRHGQVNRLWQKRRLRQLREGWHNEALPAGQYVAARACKAAAFFFVALLFPSLKNRPTDRAREDFQQGQTTNDRYEKRRSIIMRPSSRDSLRIRISAVSVR